MAEQRRGSHNHAGGISTNQKLNELEGPPSRLNFAGKAMRTPTGMNTLQKRPSNVTDNRSTAIHSGFPSPSTNLFNRTRGSYANRETP